jgi:hypothetical protein
MAEDGSRALQLLPNAAKLLNGTQRQLVTQKFDSGVGGALLHTPLALRYLLQSRHFSKALSLLLLLLLLNRELCACTLHTSL